MYNDNRPIQQKYNYPFVYHVYYEAQHGLLLLWICSSAQFYSCVSFSAFPSSTARLCSSLAIHFECPLHFCLKRAWPDASTSFEPFHDPFWTFPWPPLPHFSRLFSSSMSPLIWAAIVSIHKMALIAHCPFISHQTLDRIPCAVALNIRTIKGKIAYAYALDNKHHVRRMSYALCNYLFIFHVMNRDDCALFFVLYTFTNMSAPATLNVLVCFE